MSRSHVLCPALITVALFGTGKRGAGQAPQAAAVPTLPPEAPVPPPINGNVSRNGDHGIFERPGGPTVTALLRRKLLIAVCALLLAALGFAYGMLRAPTYESSASLQVGQVNPNSPGFMSYTQSASSLAEVFSRAVYAEPVLKEVEAKLGVPAGVAASRLAAEPIPLSPVFRVIATGPSAAASKNLADAASEAVVGYVGRSNSANPQSTALLHEAEAAAISLRHAEAAVNHLSPGAKGRFEAEATRNVARLKLEAISKSYVETVATQAPRAGLVSLVAGATTASSDRQSKAQLYGLVGLFAGLLLGCCLAVGLERRRPRLDVPPRFADAPSH